jgi:Ca-activated chloride channel family protein
MKSRITALKAMILLVITGLLMNTTGILGQTERKDDKTLSPYFFVNSENPDIDQLPLESTNAEVNISGIVADVQVTQVYKNTGKTALEAIYVFPASTRAAVYAMKMKIGEREINAIIQEREQARASYDKAIKEGKTASLLEQQRPNVFQMNVGNILPGDLIKVELSYTEIIVPTEGIYQFVYPTVVGPRYSNKNESDVNTAGKWVENPYHHQGEKPSYTFNITTRLSGGMPVSSIQCNSHDINVKYLNENTADINLKSLNGSDGNRDFILEYKLAGKSVSSGLLLYQGKDENYFLAMLQPPAHTGIQQVTPRDYVFIMDVSGSMYGFPLEISKTLMKNLLSGLRSSDRFNILLFSGGSSLFSQESVEADPEILKKAIKFIDEQRGGGGTELISALKTALNLKGTENYSRTFVIATDGYVDVEKESFDLIRNNLNKANFFAFGIGSSVNRFIMEGMAHAGNGEAFIATNEDEARTKAAQFRKYIESPVLTHIKVNFEGFDAYDVEPISIPDVFAERPVMIMGKWRGIPHGKIVLKGINAEKEISLEQAVSLSKTDNSNLSLKYLWARERIRTLNDYENLGATVEGKKKIIQLGLKYNLLTSYTSFIAIDSVVRSKDGKIVIVKQPLPLPSGVSDYSVGESANSRSMAGYSSGVVYKSSAKEISGAGIHLQEPTQGMDAQLSKDESEMPVFSGGEKALRKFLLEHLIYPDEFKKSGLKGKVFVTFTVNEDGTISDISIIKGLNSRIDSEVIRVIKLTSKMWQPGKNAGSAVKMKCPVTVYIEAK